MVDHERNIAQLGFAGSGHNAAGRRRGSEPFLGEAGGVGDRGKSVVVKRMNSVQVEGKLLAIGADSITVRRQKRPEVISRENVFRVRYANIRRRNTLLGMAIGAGVMAIFGSRQDYLGRRTAPYWRRLFSELAPARRWAASCRSGRRCTKHPSG